MAFDGSTARATIARQPPALLLLDMRMPGVIGPMLLDQLREANLLQMPVVLMTAAPQDIPALRVADISAVLAKPFDLNVLLACIARLVPQATSSSKAGVAQTGNGVNRW
jgi:DNA-binding response OmpR family regulator